MRGSLFNFLAIPSSPLETANTLVVEGWVFEWALQANREEILHSRYAHVVVSGHFDPDSGPGSSNAVTTAERIRRLGVDPATILVYPTPISFWNRTSNSAREVRDQLIAAGIRPSGVNVLTVDVHARQTQLAYTRIMRDVAAVGIITAHQDRLKPSTWPLTVHGWRIVPKNFVGWFREWAFGLRG